MEWGGWLSGSVETHTTPPPIQNVQIEVVKFQVCFLILQQYRDKRKSEVATNGYAQCIKDLNVLLKRRVP